MSETDHNDCDLMFGFTPADMGVIVLVGTSLNLEDLKNFKADFKLEVENLVLSDIITTKKQPGVMLVKNTNPEIMRFYAQEYFGIPNIPMIEGHVGIDTRIDEKAR